MEVTNQNLLASEGLKFLLLTMHGSFFELLAEILRDGGQTKLGIKEAIRPIRHRYGMAGFEYLQGDVVLGSLYVGVLAEGGFVVESSLHDQNGVAHRFDIYQEEGHWERSEYTREQKLHSVERLQMELTCPIVNYLLNYLGGEYSLVKEGKTHTQLIHMIERFLRTCVRTGQLKTTAIKEEQALSSVFKKIEQRELDPVLTWEERQAIYRHMRTDLMKVIRTKARAFGRSSLPYKLEALRQRISNFFKRVTLRPMDNFRGLLNRYTVAKIVWFFSTVKNNLGYSIALAVYGPFTYYFITMPMNPHAMQAVGRVREVYIETKSELNSALNAIFKPQEKTLVLEPKPQPQQTTPVTDTVATTQAAPAVSINSAINMPAIEANIIGLSQVTKAASALKVPGVDQAATPSLMNLLLTTDVAAANEVSWSERMGNFKQMQIAYEESLEYAPRMGRLEQLETQYNFPMIVESSWEEMERYLNHIFVIRQERGDKVSAKFRQYLANEVERTQQLQLYLWDRLARFILDQPYVMLDQDKEQKRSDYYIGRAFVFLQEMTQTLSWRYQNLKKPAGMEKIEKLADFYKKSRQETGNIINNLQANSDLFKQKDPYSSKEFRSYMKRQWEILFLQNAKAEEASNNGLNMYIWSVRNTIWCMQSIYSAKREDLMLLESRDIKGPLDNAQQWRLSKIDMLYETLFHNLTLEWVGIRAEIGESLAKDIENIQRNTVVSNLKESLTDRSKLFNQMMPTQAQGQVK